MNLFHLNTKKTLQILAYNRILLLHNFHSFLKNFLHLFRKNLLGLKITINQKIAMMSPDTVKIILYKGEIVNSAEGIDELEEEEEKSSDSMRVVSGSDQDNKDV